MNGNPFTSNGENGHATHSANGTRGPKINGGDGRSFAHDEETFTRKTSERRKKKKTSREQNQRALPSFNPELEPEPAFRLPFDPWRLIAAAKRNLGWVIFGSILAGMLGFFLAAFAVDYKVWMPLMRKTSNAMRNEGMQMIDKFMVREYSDQTIYAFMKSGDVLQNVVAKAAANPQLAPLHVTAQQLAEAISVKPLDNPDFVLLSMKAFGGLRSMVDLMNLYAEEVVSYTKQLQRGEAVVITDYLQKQLDDAELKIKRSTEELREFSSGGLGDYEKESDLDIKQLIALKDKLAQKRLDLETLGKRIAVRNDQLKNQAPINNGAQRARAELQQMLLTMTEENPLVKQKRAEITMLEKQKVQDVSPGAMDGPNGASNPLYLQVLDLQAQKPALETEIAEAQAALEKLENGLKSRANTDVGFTLKKAELQSLKTARDSLQLRLRDAQLFVNNSLGYFSVREPATMGNINYKSRWIKVGILGFLAAFAGLVLTLGIVMLSEAFDTSLKTAEDITRVTGLPVLATLGDLRKMSASAQVNWAFRTLTLLKGKLSRNSDQALVCGIMSANHGEGRSTWVNLLTSAASQRGLRVLTVDTRPTAAAPSTGEASRDKSAPVSQKAGPKTEEKNEGASTIHLPDHPPVPETSVITTPAMVAQKFEDPNCQAVVHIPLPGWVWSLERRKQWQDALDTWKDIDNLVIFVELPPASEPEAVLLAENLPQLIWLVGSGMADTVETKTHLETIQHARCNLVGAVLNYAPPPLFNTRLARWFQRMTTMFLLLGTLSFVRADELEPSVQLAQATPNPELRPAVATGSEKMAFSASARRKRAAWQERLTFGPGDAMDIHVFGKPTLSRTNVVVAPDGRISFLQANNIPVSGMTVEELRAKLDSELARYYTEAAAPRTIVVPVAFASKKYFMLGKINGKGAYVMDRPITLVEAVARAKGIETGLYQRTTVEVADLGHSFLVRNGEKLSLDFEKLFQEGDLSQNVLLEPNDYIYFASTSVNEIYVLGEVMSPGPIGFVPNATVLTAITDRGGYSDRAFKKRVLVVRGSLRQPETFVIDTGGVLDARYKDFKLQPRDIVYVGHRPWVYAEDLLDEAASSFIQGAVTTWSGVNIGPIITKRLLPRAR